MAAGDEARTKRVRMDYDERRESILRAATGLFLQRPYSQVSISDIAESAGVARGLLHHYFDSKRDLYLEVVRAVSRRPAVPVPGPSSGAGGGDEALVDAVDALLGFVADDPERWLNAIAVGGAERDDEVTSIVDDSREVLAEQTVLALGLADRDSPAVRALVRGYGGLVQEITLEWLVRGRLTRAEARQVLVKTFPLLIQHVLPDLESG